MDIVSAFQNVSTKSDQAQRFLQEAQAASALDHPNICNIHEINETDDGQLSLVMAHYEGETQGADQQRAAVSPLCRTPCSVNRRGVR